MKKLKQTFYTLLANDNGAEVMEYALVLGLVIVTAIAVVGAYGTKVVSKWTSVNSSM